MGYHWNELEKIFQEGLEIPKEKRTEFVKLKAKADKELELTLLKMFDNADEADGFFQNLQKDIAAGLDQKPALFTTGDTIGKFKILSIIGKGGMGEVYLAERNDDSYQQQVAIKCFSSGVAKDTFLKNFRQEQQFLANLNHPNIAYIIDGGLSDQGIPFIIMEFVNGLDIKAHVSKNSLKENQVLVLFRQIAQTVQFAHSQLVLHLDIKPNNILVNQNGIVKLLDFGIAKELDKALAQSTLRAASPQFAAPEQLRGKQTSVGTDIYQLGILLHLLLTNELPFNNEGDANSFVADARTIHIDTTLAAELQAIIRKCLHEHVEDRYQSVEKLSIDLANYQNNYPVDSFSDSWNYRTGKYLKRNWIAASLIALVFISLIGGTIISVQQAGIAEAEKEKAEKTADFIKDLFVSSNPLSEGEDYSTLTVFDFFDSKKNSIVDNNSLSDEIKWELLGTLFNIYRELDENEKALEITSELQKIVDRSESDFFQTVLNTKKGFAYSLDYDFKKADSCLSLAYDRLDLLLENEELTAASLLNQIGLNLHLQGQYDSAQFFYRNSLKLLNQINKPNHAELIEVYVYYSQLKRSIGQFDSAFQFSDLAVESKIREFGENSPQLISTYADRALINMEVGRYQLSEKDFQKAFSIGFDRVDSTNTNMLIILGNYIILQNLKSEYEKAVRLGVDYLDLSIRSFGYNNINVAYAKLQLADSYLAKKDLLNAEKHFSEGYQILLTVQDRNLFMEGIYLMQMSKMEIDKKNYAQALDYANSSMKIMSKMLPPDHYRLAIINIRKGKTLTVLNNSKDGETMIKEGVEILKESGAKTKKYLKEALGYL